MWLVAAVTLDEDQSCVVDSSCDFEGNKGWRKSFTVHIRKTNHLLDFP